MPANTHPDSAPADLPIGINRREFPRYPTLQRCFVWPEGADGEGWRCIAYNISLTGIGLTLPVPLPADAVIRVLPHGLPGARPLRARLVHVRRLEWAFLCGCEFFEPLSEAELQTWRA